MPDDATPVAEPTEPTELVDATESAPAGSPGRVARAKAKAAEISETLVEARQRVVPLDVAWTTFESDRSKNGNVIAGAVAFRLFVYLLPMYLLILVGLGIAFAIDPKSPDKLASNAGVSDYIASTISSSSETSHKTLWLLIPVTLYALASAGLAAYRTIATAHTSAWELPPAKGAKPWVVVPGFLGFSIAAMAISQGVSTIRDGRIAPLLTLVTVATFFGLWLAASLWLPRPAETTWRDLVPGAALVAVATQGLYWFNVLYLSHKVSSASEAYGALGIAATTLAWLYLIGRVIVAAPMLNASLWRRSRLLADDA